MAKEAKKRLVLLDAHAIIHRAYHALPDFSSSKGEPTGALYGLSTMLMKIIQELNPDYIAACFDLPKPTFRHEVFDDYKAGRKEADDELARQLERSRDVFAAFGIPIYDAEGFEADDVLGTIVAQLKNKPVEIVIASGDMDTLQLVEESRVSVYTLRKGIQDTIVYDEAAVQHRFGFGSNQLPDYKGLRGDPSDNIPGVRGVGEKTATQLITVFGTLEEIYQQLEASEEAFGNKGFKPRVAKLLKEGKDEAFFSKMLATIRHDAPVTYTVPTKVWRDAINLDEVYALFTELEFRTLSARVKTLLGVGAEEAQHETAQEEIDERELARTAIALWVLRSDTTNPTREDVLQFAPGKPFAEAQKAIFEMLAERDLQNVFTNIEEPLIEVVSQMNKNGVALDVTYLKKLSDEYHTKLSKIEKSIYKHAGVAFNINSPKQLGEILFDRLALTPKNQKRTATGQRSTREAELEKLRGEHPIVENIFAYRELQKLLSTYIDTLPRLVGDDGRLHAEFLQAGTTTGRMASQNPNLQNIPIKTELGHRVRNAFVAERGNMLVALDYSQIELRIAAILSHDEKLLAVFRTGGDVHTAVAAEVFNVPPEMVNKEMRRQAKVINFGILYGMGVNALRANLGSETTQKEARKFYDTYFRQYAGLARWIDHTKADATRLGYTQTLFGRRRYFEGITSHMPHIRAAAERMAINAPIQGTQADIVKIAMVRVHAYLAKKKLLDSVRLVLQVHDELVYEISKERADESTEEIEKIMEGVLTKEETHGVPLSVDVQVGKNWGEMKKKT
jgi:DNA polymerase-1